jgi:hypothetical protein
MDVFLLDCYYWKPTNINLGETGDLLGEYLIFIEFKERKL